MQNINVKTYEPHVEASAGTEDTEDTEDQAKTHPGGRPYIKCGSVRKFIHFTGIHDCDPMGSCGCRLRTGGSKRECLCNASAHALIHYPAAPVTRSSIYTLAAQQLTNAPVHTLACSPAHPLTRSMPTCSPAHSLTHSPTHKLTRPSARPLARSPTHPLTRSCSPIRSINGPLTMSARQLGPPPHMGEFQLLTRDLPPSLGG